MAGRDTPGMPGPAGAATRRRVVAAGITGNVLEWYDFAVYGYYAPIIGRLFFPSDDPVTSLIASFGAFAAGFLMRPVGGFVFGHIGDRIGRKRALVLSVMLMAIPTGIIGVLPDHAAVGAAAAVLMVAMRMLQGLSVGGEYTCSVVFLAEHAPAKRRGFFSSWSLFGAVGGILLGSGVAALISNLLSDAAVESWGWRIPFLVGVLVGIVGLAIRRHLPEMAKDAGEAGDRSPVVEAFRTEWRQILRVAGINVVNAVGFYMIFVYMVTWLVGRVKEPRSDALDINTVSMAALLVLIPFFGWLSDRTGRRPPMLIGTAGLALFAYPLMQLMHHPDPLAIQLGQLGFVVLLAAYFGALPAAMTEMFPHRVRVSAISVSYNVTLGILGGTTPLIATWLIARSHDDLSIAYYLIGCALVSFAVLLTMRETAGRPLPD